MGRGLAGPVCRPGIRMVSCWRNEVCKIRRTSEQGSPEPRAWMPGQEQSWPRAQCRRALGRVPPASAQALPTVHPDPSPSSPTPTDRCTACFSLVQGLHRLPHSPHPVSGGHFLCVWPWCGRPGTLASKHFPLLGRTHLHWRLVGVGSLEFSFL